MAAKNSPAVGDLLKRRESLVKHIQRLNLELRSASEDLAHLDAVLRMLDSDIQIPSFAQKGQPAPFQAARGEMSRLILSHLRREGRPVPTNEITTRVMQDRQLDPDDRRLRQMIQGRVSTCLKRWARRGVVIRHERRARYAYWSVG